MLGSKSSIAGSMVGGMVHAAVAIVLWEYFGLDNLWELLRLKPGIGVYVLLGVFLLGFVPVVLYLGRSLVSPGIVVAVLLLVSGFASWQAGPVRAPAGWPTPFGFYVLLWVLVIAVAGVAGAIEESRGRRAA